ncbi:MAG: flavin-containing monooxygenase [Nocardioidaceae bacterium]
MIERACIIGAGSSGLTAAQVLQERGIPFDCFEKGSRVGGNWCYLNDNGQSSAYESLHINTSRELMEYAAYPMPADYPDYPGHREIQAYFEDYAAHFGLAEHISFRTEVARVAPAAAGPGYDVTLGTGETRRYRWVLVANGHHWDPRWPEPAFPGEFAGEQLHSHDYKARDVLVGKRVLVLGIGNSACDIAVESSRVSERTFLAMRRGAHIIPKYLFGRPTDVVNRPLASLPMALQRPINHVALRLARGRVEDYGLPTPDHRLLDAHPTISSDLLPALGHGRIQVKPSIERLEGGQVRFSDGTTEDVDLIVYCTGYRITFPFFDDDFLTAPDNRVPLYRRVVDPEHPGLFFIGLIQPLGAVMPLAELQSQWVADLIDGSVTLLDRAVMRRAIARDDRAMRRRYVASPRHTVEVDFWPYRRQLLRERRTRTTDGAGSGAAGRVGAVR